MDNIKKRIKRTIKHIKNDTKASVIVLTLITTLILGTFLVGFVKSFIILAVISLIIYIAMIRRKAWYRKYGNDPVKLKKRAKIKGVLLIICLIFAIILIIGAAFFCFYIVKNAPSFSTSKLYKQETSLIYDSEGNIIAKLGSEQRVKVDYNELPQVLVDAVIATEDSRYLQHNGFDLPRFAKASFGQLTGNSSAGGGSTITMQVVKNTLTSSNQNLIRKFTDIYLAVFVLEKKYTKQEIFELYVNIPYLGSDSYGVEQASETYFGKHVSQLNLSEAALIAGLFQSPTAYDPYNHPVAAAKRRSTVLYLMKLHGYITQEEADEANSIPIASLLVSTSEKVATTNPYQAYVDTVVAEVETKTGTNPYATAMDVYTTMKKDKQDALNSAVAASTFQNDKVQTGIAMTNTNTGAIVAIYGGRNKSGERTYNYATDIKRQIGSTAKPIYDYGPGVEYLDWNELTTFVDEPWTYSDGVSVKDWDGKYLGTLTMKEALGLSRNIPALKAFQTLGYKKSMKFALSLGMSPEIVNGVMYETHAIGAYIGESPLTMAAAYAAFGNGGYYIKPYSVTKIVYKKSGTEKDYTAKKTQVMSDSTAYIITDCLLWTVNYGLASAAKVSGIEVAGKTGTTNFDDVTVAAHHLPGSAVNDLWMIAYTPSYSLAVWYGYDTVSATTYNVAGANKSLLQHVVKAVFTETGAKFTVPDSVIKVGVEEGSNPISLPSDSTPADQIVYAWFKKGSEPTTISSKYNSLTDVSNLSGTLSGTKATLTWDYTISSSLQSYLTTNASTVGTIGYNVYKKNSSGTLTLLGYTTDKTYTDSNVTSDTTYIVKATYSLSQTTESTGTSVTVSASSFTISAVSSIIVPSGTDLTTYDNTKDGITVKDLTGTEINTYTKTISSVTNAGGTVDKTTFNSTPGTYNVIYNITYAGDTIKTTAQAVTIS